MGYIISEKKPTHVPEHRCTETRLPLQLDPNFFRVLHQLKEPATIWQNGQYLTAAFAGTEPAGDDAVPAKFLFTMPAYPIEQLGDADFRAYYSTQYAYMAGSMAHGISSEEMVIQLGKAGFLGSFGAGGVLPDRVERAIHNIQAALPDGPYAFNLIFNPYEPALERQAAELYVQHHITTIEASAFLDITLPLVYYRTSGLSQNPDGSIRTGHRVIAKLSRKEVASRFMHPAPADLTAQLVQEGKITPQQAHWAELVPLADDVTVEADSGGHTDNRPLVCLLPVMLTLRDEIQQQQKYKNLIRVGAAGGIGTPMSALAAFTMGAAYIVTGSINQSCVEAGASEHTRRLLAQADMAEVIMAPAADMFEMGVKVQVLKRGSMFAMRAQKLFELYKDYDSIEQIPLDERQKLEKQVFKASMDEIWAQTERFFTERDPSQVERALSNGKYKMALVFRWYLGLSSHWSTHGEKGREMDYQIWCGPSMGAFNDWVKGSHLEDPANRSVVESARQIMTGAAYLSRLQLLRMNGIQVPPQHFEYHPVKL